MYRRFLQAKIHGAWVTHANLAYEGSVTISPELLNASGILPHESVEVWNLSNGNRLQTYVIKGEENSGDISLNGAAAHLMNVGDQVIIAAFTYLEENIAVSHEPTVVFVDKENRIREIRSELAGPKLISNS